MADFKNGSNQSIEYAYDKNGNLTKDLNKGIPKISYNSLNLPVSLSIANASGSATNSYTYSADGKKLKVEMKFGNQTKTTDYVDNMIYENGSLKRILVDGGYIENSKYHFFIQDHLDNNRVVAQSDGTVLQTNHYYPFGLTFTENNTGDSKSQPYKYNGKEFDGERGLNVYDYSARYMDPALGRFMTVDPLAEANYSMSSYSYCSNNPINRADPNGMLDDWIYNKEEEKYVWDGNVTEANQTPKGFEYVGPSLKDVNNHFEDNNSIISIFTNPKFGENRTFFPGEILSPDILTTFEMWLDSHSNNIGESVGKTGANIGYGIVNSPYSLLTGKTIGGTPLNANDKMDAFVDVVPGLISGGLTKTGQVIKTTGKGLQGYNQFLKGAKKSGMELKGLNWQKTAGNAFQRNKLNQQGLKIFDKGLGATGIINTTKKEFEKNR